MGQEIFSALYPEGIVTKISSCQVKGIRQLAVSFGSIFLLLFYESSWGISLAPPLNDSPLLKGCSLASHLVTESFIMSSKQ